MQEKLTQVRGEAVLINKGESMDTCWGCHNHPLAYIYYGDKIMGIKITNEIVKIVTKYLTEKNAPQEYIDACLYGYRQTSLHARKYSAYNKKYFPDAKRGGYTVKTILHEQGVSNCTTCEKVLHLSNFGVNSSKNPRSMCKKCDNARVEKTGVRKKKKKKNICKECGGENNRPTSSFCSPFHSLIHRMKDKTKGSMKVSGAMGNTYRNIRDSAMHIIKYYNVPKVCYNCGYSLYTEIAHIKAISDFKDSDTLYEINAITNLVPLCPNCHKAYDMGIIDIDFTDHIQKYKQLWLNKNCEVE